MEELCKRKELSKNKKGKKKKKIYHKEDSIGKQNKEKQYVKLWSSLVFIPGCRHFVNTLFMYQTPGDVGCTDTSHCDVICRDVNMVTSHWRDVTGRPWRGLRQVSPASILCRYGGLGLNE